MKVLVTGVGGQLRHDCMIELEKRGYEAVGLDLNVRISLDVTDRDAVLKVIQDIKSDAVIHCAVWTA